MFNKFLSLLVLILISGNSWAKLKVRSTLPELNWLATEIGKDLVEANSLLSGHEDPHFVDVTPAFIFKIKNIDILVKNGLALESTWLPKIIELAANSKLDNGGLCNASSNLDTMGELQNADRSMGDVHPEGNPHYSYSPKQMILAAVAIKNCFQKNDKKNFNQYENNFKAVKVELTKLDERMRNSLNNYSGIKIMTYHEEFKYLCRDYGLKCIKTVEDTPGVLPSASNLAKKSIFAKKNQVKFVLATDSNPKRILDKFSEMTDIPYGQIEAHMNTKVKDYKTFVLQIVTIFEKLGK